MRRVLACTLASRQRVTLNIGVVLLLPPSEDFALPESGLK